MDWRERIAVDPNVMVGKPVIQGTRLAVEFIVDLLANEWSYREILESYPGISNQDIVACLQYAHDVLKDGKEYPLKA